MKGREFIKRLRRAGVVIIEGRGKGGHVLALYGNRQATVPFHGDADLGHVFIKKIIKQLGLDPQEVL